MRDLRYLHCIDWTLQDKHRNDVTISKRAPYRDPVVWKHGALQPSWTKGCRTFERVL